MPSFKSVWDAAKNAWGIFQSPKYDAIIVGSGPGGCTLAQTLVDGGLTVLLVERGDERNDVTDNILTQDLALLDECVEKFSSKGVIVGTGNCIGGASSWNLGVWIEEEVEFLKQSFDPSEPIFTNEQMQAAYNWTRDRIAPEPTLEEGNQEVYMDELIDVYEARPDFKVINTVGQPEIELDGAWRIHSHFNATSRDRRSADTILERNNPRLDVRTKTEVKRILFDGDRVGIPPQLWKKRGDTPRARCVRFTSLEVVCVKDEGRIFLAAGVFHSPELLIKNGIGDGGYVVDNPEVGKNLNDKPVVLFFGNFQKDFQIPETVSLSHITATKQYPPSNGADNKTLVFAEFSYGEPDDGRPIVLNLVQVVRTTLPTSVRTGPVGDIIFLVIEICTKKVQDPPLLGLGPLCKQFNKVVEAGCDNNAFGMEMFMGSPTSRGELKIDTQGKIIVDVNYLDTEDDLEAWGQGIRTNYEILSSYMGASAGQQPCESDDNCPADNCPRILNDLYELTKTSVKLLNPKAAKKMISAPPSVVFPHNVEKVINEGNTDLEIGNILREDVYSGQHSCGTCSIGKVVDNKFKVKGVDGLYIADGSVIPVNPRANPMSVIYMYARLCGVNTLEELGLEAVP